MTERGTPSRGPSSDADPDAVDLDEILPELHARHRASAQLLGLLSFLAPEPVPAWLLAEGSDALPHPLAGRVSAGTEAALLAAEPLEARELAGLGKDAVWLAGGVGEAVRKRMSVRERGEFGGAAVRLLHDAFPDRVGRPEHRARCRALAPHARAAAEHPRGGGRTTAEAAHLLARLGAFHRAEGEAEEAESVYRQALEVAERGAPVEGVLRAVLRDELASVLVARGRPDEAVSLAEESVALAEEELPPDAPQLPLLLANAATTLREAEELEGAADCFGRALDAAEEAGSVAARPLVVELLAGLADVELARDRPGEAAEAATRALEAAEEEWGERHAQTARAAWILGDARRELGDAEGAAELFRRSLRVERELHGDGHPAVGQKALGLARHLVGAGRGEEARAAYRRALDAFAASLGPDSDPARTARRELEGLGG